MPAASSDPSALPASVIEQAQPQLATGGCSAAEPGANRPVLGSRYSKPFRWEVVPQPNPDCAATGDAGEADTRAEAERALRQTLTGYAAGMGFLYEVRGDPAQVTELVRIPIAAPDPKPPR